MPPPRSMFHKLTTLWLKKTLSHWRLHLFTLRFHLWPLMVTHILKGFSPSSSPTILVFPHQTVRQYSNGDPVTGASNAKGVWKITIFNQYLALSWNRCKIEPTEPWLLWKANRKPHPSFQMVPISMTLSDL